MSEHGKGIKELIKILGYKKESDYLYSYCFDDASSKITM
jgi:hypothetical protein